MRPKKPTHVLIDQVRIAHEGSDAIIDHADANFSGARITGIATMTDAEVVEMYNQILDSQWALLEPDLPFRRRRELEGPVSRLRRRRGEAQSPVRLRRHRRRRRAPTIRLSALRGRRRAWWRGVWVEASLRRSRTLHLRRADPFAVHAPRRPHWPS